MYIKYFSWSALLICCYSCSGSKSNTKMPAKSCVSADIGNFDKLDQNQADVLSGGYFSLTNGGDPISCHAFTSYTDKSEGYLWLNKQCFNSLTDIKKKLTYNFNQFVKVKKDGQKAEGYISVGIKSEELTEGFKLVAGADQNYKDFIQELALLKSTPNTECDKYCFNIQDLLLVKFKREDHAKKAIGEILDQLATSKNNGKDLDKSVYEDRFDFQKDSRRLIFLKYLGELTKEPNDDLMKLLKKLSETYDLGINESKIKELAKKDKNSKSNKDLKKLIEVVVKSKNDYLEKIYKNYENDKEPIFEANIGLTAKADESPVLRAFTIKPPSSKKATKGKKMHLSGNNKESEFDETIELSKDSLRNLNLSENDSGATLILKGFGPIATLAKIDGTDVKGSQVTFAEFNLGNLVSKKDQSSKSDKNSKKANKKGDPKDSDDKINDADSSDSTPDTPSSDMPIPDLSKIPTTPSSTSKTNEDLDKSNDKENSPSSANSDPMIVDKVSDSKPMSNSGVGGNTQAQSGIQPKNPAESADAKSNKGCD